jgi:hypothetical protein
MNSFPLNFAIARASAVLRSQLAAASGVLDGREQTGLSTSATRAHT